MTPNWSFGQGILQHSKCLLRCLSHFLKFLPQLSSFHFIELFVTFELVHKITSYWRNSLYCLKFRVFLSIFRCVLFFLSSPSHVSVCLHLSISMAVWWIVMLFMSHYLMYMFENDGQKSFWEIQYSLNIVCFYLHNNGEIYSELARTLLVWRRREEKWILSEQYFKMSFTIVHS